MAGSNLIVWEIAAVKPMEDSISRSGRDADARVADTEESVRVVKRCGQNHRPTRNVGLIALSIRFITARRSSRRSPGKTSSAGSLHSRLTVDCAAKISTSSINSRTIATTSTDVVRGRGGGRLHAKGKEGHRQFARAECTARLNPRATRVARRKTR